MYLDIVIDVQFCEFRELGNLKFQELRNLGTWSSGNFGTWSSRELRNLKFRELRNFGTHYRVSHWSPGTDLQPAQLHVFNVIQRIVCLNSLSLLHHKWFWCYHVRQVLLLFFIIIQLCQRKYRCWKIKQTIRHTRIFWNDSVGLHVGADLIN